MRVHEALKDESPALLHELQRLEYKVNILLRLTAELALRSSGLPAADRVRMSSRGLEWFGEHPAAADATGLLSIYINSALPQPLKIPSVVAGDASRRWHARHSVPFRRLERCGGGHARETHFSSSSTIDRRRETGVS